VNVLECPADGGARKINDFALHTRNYRWIGVTGSETPCLPAGNHKSFGKLRTLERFFLTLRLLALRFFV
jgi:hypothetical protein